MVRSCPNCGLEGVFGTAKFCHNCGKALIETNDSSDRRYDRIRTSKLTSSNVLFQHIVNEKENIIADKQQDNEDISSIYDLGVNLEEVVEQILKKRGVFYKKASKIKRQK